MALYYVDDRTLQCGWPLPYVDARGEFAHLCTIPVGYLGFGAHQLCASTQDPSLGPQPIAALACAAIVIDVPPGSPAITLGVAHGIPGTNFSVTGVRFPPSGSLVVYIDARSVSCGPSVTADVQGGFTSACDLPWQQRLNPGTHSVCADNSDPSLKSQPTRVLACAPIVVDPLGLPAITVGAPYTWPNSALTVFDIAGTGFPPGLIAAVHGGNAFFCGIPTLLPPTDAQGSFSRKGCGFDPKYSEVCADTGWIEAQPIKVLVCAPLATVAPSPSTSPVVPSPSPSPKLSAAGLGSLKRTASGGPIALTDRPSELLALLGVAAIAGLAWFGIQTVRRRRRLRS